MTRKRCNRRAIVPMPPRGLRPKLARDQVTDLAHVHIGNLDDMAHGRGTVDLLWQVTGGVLTWSRVAQLLGRGEAEMSEQLDTMTSVIQRWQRTGLVRFSGPEYQLAKYGVAVMDQLAELVDKPTAVAAAIWSEEQVNRLRVRAEAGTPQPSLDIHAN